MEHTNTVTGCVPLNPFLHLLGGDFVHPFITYNEYIEAIILLIFKNFLKLKTVFAFKYKNCLF